MWKEIETELLVAREASNLIHRRPSFVKLVVGLYALSLFDLENGRVMRASYLPVRFVDDLLDGDTKFKSNLLHYAEELKDNIIRNSLTKTGVERQLKYAIDNLESRAKSGDNPRGDFVKSINSIIFDYHRAKERRVLTLSEVEDYYKTAFDPVINITLMATDSSIRSKDIPALSYGQGRVYSIRDIITDWQRGIINVPKEVLDECKLSSSSSSVEVGNNPIFKRWTNISLQETKPDLINTQKFLKELNEKQTFLVCNSLISPMIKFIDKYY
ncbi:MAG: hypothetical protein Q8Q30_00765 [Candidatus Woesebacteria bacterium]|nr:hypothetical protein [Candidatus Woesebacteria bacterium]